MTDYVVYEIFNVASRQRYIGSSVRHKTRFRTHQRQLSKGVHANTHLQAAWDVYGKDTFKFRVLKRFTNEKAMQEFEQSIIRAEWDESHTKLYNAKIGVARAPLHPQEVKDKISSGVQQAHTEKRGIYKGYKQDEEHRQAISNALKGNQNAKGYKRTEAEREAIRQRTLGNQHWLNKKHSAESKDKMGTTAYAEAPDGSVTEYISINEMRMQLGMAGLSGILRAIKSGYPLASGAHAGWRFFTEKEDNRAVIPDEYKHLPRSRAEAKNKGEKLYFNTIPCKRGHVAPRKAKGTCTMCPA